MIRRIVANESTTLITLLTGLIIWCAIQFNAYFSISVLGYRLDTLSSYTDSKRNTYSLMEVTLTNHSPSAAYHHVHAFLSYRLYGFPIDTPQSQILKDG